ncbi:MAG: glycosyltransferase [Solirubrobacterales bacterium]
MTSVTFLLKDDPFGVDAGDTRISRLMIEIAAESFEVRALALAQNGSDQEAATVPIATVPSPRRGPVTALVRNLTSPRRSALHSYFRVRELVRAIREEESDVMVAEHTYMAEPAIKAGLPNAEEKLLINTHALQASVFAGRRSRPARLEARRIWRDELRCVRAATSTACLGGDDLERLEAAGAERLRRLDLLLPPAGRPARPEHPRALFFGGRYRWPPNQYALEKLLELWPGIERAVPGAELIVAGRPANRERSVDLPGVRIVGYVDDLDGLLARSSVLLAPVPIGGGVRVKVLEAARHGLPVVGSPQAIGSIDQYLPLTPARSDSEFAARAVSLLSSVERARETGERLYVVNRELWRSGFVHEQVSGWIAGKEPQPAVAEVSSSG